MPGIAGIIGRKPPADCESCVEAMLATMRHEPFYESGGVSWTEQGVFAGWTAHANSFAACQPFRNEERDIEILLSGECFHDPAMVAMLRRQGHRFENVMGAWLPHLYEERGERFWEELNGMFSGLLVDKRNGKVVLFNDRYGTERLYWHQTPDGFYFASEAKALLRVLPELREFDLEGVGQFLTYGCTINWRTLFRGIEILPGGSRWTFHDRTCKKMRYFDPKAWERLPELSLDDFQEKLDDTFNRVLPRYFDTDSRLGLALTGGLDTRMILACAPENIERPISYTFTGETGETFDDRVAVEVANACGLDHHLLRLGPDFFSDFASHADETVYVTDGTFGITGTHEIYFNKQGRQLAPVRLTGLFGGEILRGVSYLKRSLPPLALLADDFSQVVESSFRSLAVEETHPVTSAAFGTIPWNLYGSMAANRSQVVLRTPYLDNEIVALAYQTPSAHTRSSQSALRLIRDNDPMLASIPTDRRIEDQGASFPHNLRRLLREVGFKLDYYHNEGMPQWFSHFSPVLDAVDSRLRLFGGHKFLHYRSWFRDQLSPYVIDVLTDPRTRQSNLWSPKFLQHMAKAYTHGYGNHVLPINSVLTLEAVERLLFREMARLPDIREDIHHISTSPEAPAGENGEAVERS